MRPSRVFGGYFDTKFVLMPSLIEFHDLYMFGWNESGQLAQQTNLARPAECFSAVEKLLMACCTMQAEDAALPRGDTEDTEVYR